MPETAITISPLLFNNASMSSVTLPQALLARSVKTQPSLWNKRLLSGLTFLISPYVAP